MDALIPRRKTPFVRTGLAQKEKNTERENSPETHYFERKTGWKRENSSRTSVRRENTKQQTWVLNKRYAPVDTGK